MFASRVAKPKASPTDSDPTSSAFKKYQKSQGWQNKPKKCKKCRDKSKLCNMFSQTGECSFGDMCRFSHTDDVKARTTPGSISKECEYFKNDNCSAGDMCPYTHSGRERQQNTEAVNLEKMKESEKENTDNRSLCSRYGRSEEKDALKRRIQR